MSSDCTMLLFQWRNLLQSLFSVALYGVSFFSLTDSKNFPVLSILSNLIKICLVFIFFMFLILGIHLVSWICDSIFFSTFDVFWVLYLQIFFLFPLPHFSSPLWFPITYILGCLRSHGSMTLLPFFIVFILDSFYCYAFKFTIISSTVPNLSLISSQTEIFFSSQTL